MAQDNVPDDILQHAAGDAEPVLLSAIITPHRSLGRTGFILVMALFGAASFISGMIFLMMGAWPVFGFFGLDVALLYIALRINNARAAAVETITVTPSLITVRQMSHRGKVAEWSLNPLWVRLEKEEHEEFGIEKLYLRSRGRSYAIASFLGPDEKASFAKALNAALAAARRGIDRNAPSAAL